MAHYGILNDDICPLIFLHLFIVIIFIAYSALLIYTTVLLPLLSGIMAAVALHKFMLAGIMRAPLQFFDSTPIGRVISRFSKDVEVMDSQLPAIFLNIIFCVFEVKS